MTESPTTVELGQVCTKIGVGLAMAVTPFVTEVGVKLIRNQNIRPNKFDDSSVIYLNPEFAATQKNKTVRENDVVIVRTGANIGDACVVPKSFDGSQSFTTLLARPDAKKLHPHFLAQFVNSDFGRSEVERLMAGGGKGNLNSGELERFRITLLPIEDQGRVADVLLCWDSAIEAAERLIAAKERHYSHELSRLISRGQHPHAHVGTFAEEVSARNRGGKWRTVALSDIATVWKGQQLNKDAMVEDGAYYALNGGIKPSGRTTKWNCEADTITVSSGGNSCGFIRFNSERFWCGGDCFALKNLSPEVDVSYLFHYLKGQQHRMMALRTGSGIPHVYRADIEAFPVVLPDLDTQTAIARYLNVLREEINMLGQSVSALQTQKRGLMQKLLSGQWRITSDLDGNNQ